MPSPAQRRRPRRRTGRSRSWTAVGQPGGRRGFPKWMSSQMIVALDVAPRSSRHDAGVPGGREGSCSPMARAKWPRWLVANCNSQPSAVRHSGVAKMPALLTRMCSGPCHEATKASIESRADRSRGATRTAARCRGRPMSAAVFSPARMSRTARVTSAPALASARAVSTPMPDEAPVTMARRPVRSTPATTSAAVDRASNGVVTRVSVMIDFLRWVSSHGRAGSPYRRTVPAPPSHRSCAEVCADGQHALPGVATVCSCGHA